jgi:hypothetical protein
VEASGSYQELPLLQPPSLDGPQLRQTVPSERFSTSYQRALGFEKTFTL